MSLRVLLKRMSIMLKMAALLLIALSIADLVRTRRHHPPSPRHGVIGPLGAWTEGAASALLPLASSRAAKPLQFRPISSSGR